MTKFTIDTLPLHALHSYSANLLGVWYGLVVSDEELQEARVKRPMGKYYVIVEVHETSSEPAAGAGDASDSESDGEPDDESGEAGSEPDDESGDDESVDAGAADAGSSDQAGVTKPGQPMVRVAEIKDTIAEARGKVATHAPFARVATVRHDAAGHDAWPGSESAIKVGDRLPTALFDWTR